MTIGERIREVRKKAGMTQKEVSEKLGICYQSYSQWETGARHPKWMNVLKISEVLGVPFESLLFDGEIEEDNSMSESKTINFGSGPVGYQKEIDEEQLKALVEEIDKETKEAGLPWWKGMFNPKIIEVSGIKRSECNCDKQKDPVTARGEEKMREKNQKLKEENAFLRDERNKQLNLYNRANEKCMTAIEAMEAGMEKLQSSIVENDLTFEQLGDLTEKLARLGSAVSAVRMSMGLQVPPYLLGINSGFNSFGGD